MQAAARLTLGAQGAILAAITAGGTALAVGAEKLLKNPPPPKTIAQIVQSKEFIAQVLKSKTFWAAASTVSALALAYHWSRKEEQWTTTISSEAQEESIMTNSPLASRPAPRCQVAIAFKNSSGMLEIVGCGVRTEFGLWVPLHVLGADYLDAYAVGKNGVAVPLRNYYADSIYTPFGVEMVNIVVPDVEFSKLGVTKAKFAVLPNMDTVVITGPDGKSSMGQLRITPPENFVMGKVLYGGSTLAGFSGAPYMKGNHVVGIHLHGGKGGNGGQEVLYLNQAYKIVTGITEEANFGTEDSGSKMMEKFISRKESVDYTEIDGEFIVRDAGGHYHRTRAEVIAKYELAQRLWQEEPNDWSAEVDYQDAKRDYDEIDQMEEAAFLAMGPKRPIKYQGSNTLDKKNHIRPPHPAVSALKRLEKRYKAFLVKAVHTQKPKPCNPQTQPQQASSPPSGLSSKEGAN